jgi:soluble lytic murein transglycosylase
LLIEEQKPFAEGLYEQEYFRWMPVEILFRKGEFQQVLQWALKNRSNFKSLPILRNIDLNIARSYLRLDNTSKSIKYYLDFQKRYPRDFLSPEVLWKVAWLYEEKADIKAAIQMYRQLVNIYPRYEFYSEAYFRIGLNYFRLKKYQQAKQSWEEALKKVTENSQRDRIRYWLGKCYEMQGNFKKQGEIYIQLAERPIDTFYNLKAFYLTSDGREMHQKINEIFWKLHENQQSFLGNYIDKFRKALLVEEVLGPRWGDRELRTLSENSEKWPEMFSLGELYERMQNYGFAYRRFRNVFDRYFARSNFEEMIPIFKKLYPLYYAERIDSTTSKFDIPPELIWSVIKKESAFEAKVISYANAYGLMQLLPGTASQVAPAVGITYHSTEQLFDPDINIKMGTYYLSSLLRQYDGNYVKALAGYNAGPHRVDRWKKTYDSADDDLFMENLEFEQTRGYVRTCLKYFWIYRTITHPGEVPPEIINYPVKITDFL